MAQDRVTQDRLSDLVREQLPRGLQDRLMVLVTCDAHMLAAKAVFMTTEGRKFECVLESAWDGTRHKAYRIPETFITYLATVV